MPRRYRTQTQTSRRVDPVSREPPLISGRKLSAASPHRVPVGTRLVLMTRVHRDLESRPLDSHLSASARTSLARRVKST